MGFWSSDEDDVQDECDRMERKKARDNKMTEDNRVREAAKKNLEKFDQQKEAIDKTKFAHFDEISKGASEKKQEVATEAHARKTEQMGRHHDTRTAVEQEHQERLGKLRSDMDSKVKQMTKDSLAISEKKNAVENELDKIDEKKLEVQRDEAQVTDRLRKENAHEMKKMNRKQKEERMQNDRDNFQLIQNGQKLANEQGDRTHQQVCDMLQSVHNSQAENGILGFLSKMSHSYSQNITAINDETESLGSAMRDITEKFTDIATELFPFREVKRTPEMCNNMETRLRDLNREFLEISRKLGVMERKTTIVNFDEKTTLVNVAGRVKSLLDTAGKCVTYFRQNLKTGPWKAEKEKELTDLITAISEGINSLPMPNPNYEKTKQLMAKQLEVTQQRPALTEH